MIIFIVAWHYPWLSLGLDSRLESSNYSLVSPVLYWGPLCSVIDPVLRLGKGHRVTRPNSIVERYRWKIIKYPVFNVFLLKNKKRVKTLDTSNFARARAATLFRDFDSDFWVNILVGVTGKGWSQLRLNHWSWNLLGTFYRVKLDWPTM